MISVEGKLKSRKGIKDCQGYTVILTSAIEGAIVEKMALHEEPKDVRDR